MRQKNNMEILKMESRKKIYELIQKNPGLYFSEISRKLKIPKTTLAFHLNNLEKNELIASIYKDKNQRFFVKQNFGNLEKKLIHLLRKETTRNIILYIGWSICASQSELSRELEKSDKTIEKHLKKLLELGVIEPAPINNGVISSASKIRKIDRKPVGREILYRLASTPYPNLTFSTLIDKLFKQYRKSLAEDKTTRLILHGFKQLYAKKEIREILKVGNAYIENFEKAAYEVFPHPYHV